MFDRILLDPKRVTVKRQFIVMLRLTPYRRNTPFYISQVRNFITSTGGRAFLPSKQGLYDPASEKDSCGVGFVVDIKGVRTHTVVEQALE